METNNHHYNEYMTSLFAPQDAALTGALDEMRRENVPGINVSAVEGQLLHLLALMVGAKRILEIGTLGGYSGIHFARALPEDGQLVTLEIDPHHAEVARRNFERAGVQQKVDMRVAPALETLRDLANTTVAPFDLIFIDADKESYLAYLEHSLPLLREGGLLLGDNTLRDVGQQEDSIPLLYNAAVARHPELTSIIIPILRQHGLDGLTVSLKRTPAS